MGDRGGRRSPSSKAVIAGGGVGLLLVGIAVLMPKVFPFLRGDRDAPIVLPDAPVIADYLIVVLTVVMVVVAVVLRLSVASISDPTQVKRRKPIAAQILLVLLFFWGGALIASKLTEAADRRGTTTPSAEATSPATGNDGAAGRGSSRTLGLMLTVGLGLVVVGLAAAAVYLTKGERGEASTARALAAELEVGIEDVRSARDPRDAVVTCFARMEALLKAAGADARRSYTPFEFVERALTDLDVPAAAARRLTELFERARFSPHGTDEGMRIEAVAALEDVRSSLREEPSWAGA